jgi:hypothetical protein
MLILPFDSAQGTVCRNESTSGYGSLSGVETKILQGTGSLSGVETKTLR